MEKYFSEIFSAWCIDTKQPHNKDSIEPLRQALNRQCSEYKIVLRSQRIGINTASAIAKLLMDQTQIHTLDLHENVVRDKGVMALVDTFISAPESSRKQHRVSRFSTSFSESQTHQASPPNLSLTPGKCSITYLNLGSNDIGRKGIDVLSDWIAHETCKLKTLILGSEKDELYMNKIDCEGATKLAMSLRKNSTITCLDLNRNEEIGKKSQQAFFHFAETFDPTGHLVQDFNDHDSNAHGSSLNGSGGLDGARKSPIHILRLGDVNMKSAAAIKIIQSFIGNERLRYLDLRGNKLGFQVSEALARLLSSGRNIVLENDGDQQQDFYEPTFSKTISSGHSAIPDFSLSNTKWTCNITTLLLHRNRLKNRSVQILSQALKYNNSLCVLNLSENLLGNEAAVALGDYLKDAQTLTYLDLSHNQITEQGCMILAEAIVHNPVLSHLNISSNLKIGNQGANALAKCLIQHDIIETKDDGEGEGSKGTQIIATKAESNLMNLNLNNCGVGDEGAVSICVALSCNDSLQSLGLRNNYLTEEQTGRILAEVLRLKRNESILNIDIRGNQIEHPTMLDIQRSLRRNKLNRSLMHPNMLRKQLIQLKYTEHLLSEARDSLMRHKVLREHAEEMLDLAQLEAQKMLDEYKELENDYNAQSELEMTLIQNIKMRQRAKEEDVLQQILVQDGKLNNLKDVLSAETQNKKEYEDKLAESEKELEDAKQKIITDTDVVKDQVFQLQKSISAAEKSSVKIKKELGSVKKKITSLESNISSSIIEAIEYKIAQEIKEEQANGRGAIVDFDTTSPGTSGGRGTGNLQITIEEPKISVTSPVNSPANKSTEKRKRAATIAPPPPSREVSSASKPKRSNSTSGRATPLPPPSSRRSDAKENLLAALIPINKKL